MLEERACLFHTCLQSEMQKTISVSLSLEGNRAETNEYDVWGFASYTNAHKTKP